MAAIYFHVPFCKQACHYCNFHFSTSLKHKDAMLTAMKKELIMRKAELPVDHLQSIYFGGGTPSILTHQNVDELLSAVAQHYSFCDDIEITLEMNPDDCDLKYLKKIKAAGVNRLSIGVQSFIERDLKQMNRVHNAEEALSAVEKVATTFSNYSLDLIYGMPDSPLSEWERNLATALSFSPPHLSSYALTVEPKTVLAKHVNSGRIRLLAEEEVARQFDYMVNALTEAAYVHYELSSFGKPGYFSKNNTAYWEGKPYLGIGPSAHSFYNQQRSWNSANNPKYLAAIKNGQLPIERENLSEVDQYNEYVMTGLRTIRGVDLLYIQSRFGDRFARLFEAQVEQHLLKQNLYWDGDVVKVTKKARFLVDGIASDLFLLNL